jgi:hypothetical protein
MARLTQEWTPRLDEAFGETGTKGREGEEFLMSFFESIGYSAIHYEDNYQKQIDGIDIEFKKPSWYNYYSCDVKNNMTENGTIYVWASWLFKIKADRVFHVNTKTRWLCWYSVEEMRKIYKPDSGREFMTIPVFPKIEIISRSKFN